MGHRRLGRLPRSRRWDEVVELLETSPEDVGGIAAATITAADARLNKFSHDPSLVYCFWLLTRVMSAAKGDDFARELSRLGVQVQDNTPTIAFVAQLSDQIRDRLSRHPESGFISEIASLALRAALTETVALRGKSLFATNLEDLQRSFREYSTIRQFGEVSQRFFGAFLSRVLRSLVDRELADHVGSGRSFATIEASSEFLDTLGTYSRQVSLIVRDFGGEWYSKHNWEAKGEITEDEAAGFVSHALNKLRSEVRRVP